MSTIHMHQTTTSTPEQCIAGLTDFGPGRSKLFGNSADEYLKVHSRGPQPRPTSRKARAESGNAYTTIGPIPTTSFTRRHLKHAFFWSEGWPTAPQGVAPDGIRTAKETQHQPNSTTGKGAILNELSMGTFSKSFDMLCEIRCKGGRRGVRCARH
jgi:hypothetical protein